MFLPNVCVFAELDEFLVHISKVFAERLRISSRCSRKTREHREYAEVYEFLVHISEVFAAFWVMWQTHFGSCGKRILGPGGDTRQS